MRTLLIDACDTFSSATPAPSIFVQSSNLFTSPLPLSSPAPTSSTLFTPPLSVFLPVPTSSLTPKMDRVCSVAPTTGVMTFTDPLNVSHTQSSFVHTFELDPIMIQIIKHSKHGRRALVVKCSASDCLFPEILPSAFSLPEFMYSA